MAIDQWLILILGGSSAWFLARPGPLLKWGYVLGLLAQPFWFYSAMSAGKTGMVVMCFWYTYCSALGIKNRFGDKMKTDLDKWKEWVYNEEETNFFFLCNHHSREMVRPEKDGCHGTYMAHKCDYPYCERDANYELFPNLMRVIDEHELSTDSRKEELNGRKKHAKRKSMGKRSKNNP